MTVDANRLLVDGKAQLWSELDETRTGLLGIDGAGQHMQPMSHFADPAGSAIWFVTSLATDLVRAVGLGNTAEYTVTGNDQTFWASIRGPIEQSEDRAKLDEVWSPVSAAWFAQGREDPDVCLLKLTPNAAAMWASKGGAVNFGIEIARANMLAEHQPDVGEHVVVNF